MGPNFLSNGLLTFQDGQKWNFISTGNHNLQNPTHHDFSATYFDSSLLAVMNRTVVTGVSYDYYNYNPTSPGYIVIIHDPSMGSYYGYRSSVTVSTGYYRFVAFDEMVQS